jgi:hypothetical protein
VSIFEEFGLVVQAFQKEPTIQNRNLNAGLESQYNAD